MSLSKVNNASAYAVRLRLTMLQIYLYQYWTVAETQKKGISAPRPCVDLIIIIKLLNYSYEKIKGEPRNIKIKCQLKSVTLFFSQFADFWSL